MYKANEVNNSGGWDEGWAHSEGSEQEQHNITVGTCPETGDLADTGAYHSMYHQCPNHKSSYELEWEVIPEI